MSFIVSYKLITERIESIFLCADWSNPWPDILCWTNGVEKLIKLQADHNRLHFLPTAIENNFTSRAFLFSFFLTRSTELRDLRLFLRLVLIFFDFSHRIDIVSITKSKNFNKKLKIGMQNLKITFWPFLRFHDRSFQQIVSYAHQWCCSNLFSSLSPLACP